LTECAENSTDCVCLFIAKEPGDGDGAVQYQGQRRPSAISSLIVNPPRVADRLRSRMRSAASSAAIYQDQNRSFPL
jgi:hypothetical protein